MWSRRWTRLEPDSRRRQHGHGGRHRRASKIDLARRCIIHVVSGRPREQGKPRIPKGGERHDRRFHAPQSPGHSSQGWCRTGSRCSGGPCGGADPRAPAEHRLHPCRRHGLRGHLLLRPARLGNAEHRSDRIAGDEIHAGLCQLPGMHRFPSSHYHRSLPAAVAGRPGGADLRRHPARDRPAARSPGPAARDRVLGRRRRPGSAGQ